VSDTTVLIKGEGWKFKAAIGLGGLAVVVILAFLYRLEVGLIVLAIGSAIGARVWVWAIHQHRLAGFERRRWLAEVVKAEAEAEAAKARSYFVETNTGVFVLDGIAISQFYPAVNASKLLADMPLALPAPEPPRLRRLLDVEYVHLLIVGPSGSGKTTALCWLIDAAPPGTLIYALDPHAQFGEWPGRVNAVIGNGRDYPAIDAKLQDLISTLNKRYKGEESTAQKILIVADEWLSILDKCESAREFFNVIGSEARKVNMSLVISSISAGVDDLAVSGAIRDNLAQLTLNRTLKDRNQGELKWSRRDTELVELPGRYRPLARALRASDGTPPGDYRASFTAPTLYDIQDRIEATEATQPIPVLDAGPVAPAPDPTELRIFELHQEGLSLRAIHKEVYGRPYAGGREVEELRAILRKFGVKFDVAG
jgi:hypothetical protein